MRVRGTDEDGPRLDAAFLLDRRSDRQNGGTSDEEGIDPDNGYPGLAVVEHRGAGLARIVKRTMVGLAVPTRLLHADRGRDVALGEPGFEIASGGRSSRHGHTDESQHHGRKADPAARETIHEYRSCSTTLPSSLVIEHALTAVSTQPSAYDPGPIRKRSRTEKPLAEPTRCKHSPARVCSSDKSVGRPARSSPHREIGSCGKNRCTVTDEPVKPAGPEWKLPCASVCFIACITLLRPLSSHRRSRARAWRRRRQHLRQARVLEAHGRTGLSATIS